MSERRDRACPIKMRVARRKRSRQLELRYRKHGGKREGAGRKRTLPGPRRVSHRRRPKLANRFPVHVTTRIGDHVPKLRNRRRCKIIREAMVAVLDEPGFRICHFSVQRDHLHLLCEAKDQAALARGIRRFKQRVARGLNRQLGRKGPVFLDRYHMEIVRNPRQVRHCLVYVLQNARKHGERIPAGCGDPYSSSLHFDGWKDSSWRRGLSPPPGKICISPPGTWLLREGWQRHGLIGLEEVPRSSRGPKREAR